MKVVHLLKAIEDIDEDIRELKKLEKSLQKNKSFSTAIYMSIEKQINILLGFRIKLLESRIEDPPLEILEEIGAKPEKEQAPEKKDSKAEVKIKRKITGSASADKNEKLKSLEDDDFPILTQEQIDKKFEVEQKKFNQENRKSAPNLAKSQGTILDAVLEKSINAKKDVQINSKEKKVRFFRENFPVE